MFVKYQGKFKKYEAEAVQEILDLHGGDEVAARTTVYNAYKGNPLPEFITDPAAFTTAVQGLLFAAGPAWWFAGLVHRGHISIHDQLMPLDIDPRFEGGA